MFVFSLGGSSNSMEKVPGQRPDGVSDLRHHGDGKREENNGAQASNLV